MVSLTPDPLLFLHHFLGLYWASYLLQWKLILSVTEQLSWVVGTLPMAWLMVWMGGRSGDPDVFVYVAVGVFVTLIWMKCTLQMNWAMAREFQEGTAELLLISRTPFILITGAKILATATLNVVASAVVVLGSLLIFDQSVEVSSVPRLVVSLSFAVFAVVTTAFVFTPLNVLTRARGGAVLAVTWFGVVFGGLLFPISVLPGGLQVIARFLPTTWAMEGVRHSLQGEESLWQAAGEWMASLGLTVLLLFVIYFMFKKVEERVRVSGVLSTF